jgi:hypothetical protein
MCIGRGLFLASWHSGRLALSTYKYEFLACLCDLTDRLLLETRVHLHQRQYEVLRFGLQPRPREWCRLRCSGAPAGAPSTT